MNKAAYISILVFGVMSLTSCGNRTTQSSHSNWSPPANPNPKEILSEARADAKRGNYAVALAKHVWFHENALKHDSALAGVRLSFALSDWTDLAAVYPPALEQLKSTRDNAETNVRNKNGRDAYEAFLDFSSINEKLNEDAKTKELFLWLDSNKPETARDLFSLAEPALIKEKDYNLCGKYIDAEASFAEALQNYRMTSDIAKNPKFGKKLQDFADRKFTNITTTLIALLVVNNRKPEAEQIISKLSREADIPEFQKEIQKALNGEVPSPL